MKIWDWDYAWEVLPILAEASVVTLQATLAGFLLALVVGLLFAVGRMTGPAWLRWSVTGVVEFLRSTPLLIQIFFLYYVMPEFGITLDAMPTGVLALGLHYGAYCAEVYRAGLDNVPRGQWEAAIALNLSPWVTFRRVILPQAIPPIVPALGNYLVALFKETPLLSVIAVLELMQTAKILGSESFQYTEPITLVGLFFLAFSLVSAALIRQVEKALQPRAGRRT
ncbi:MAG: ectoine/hydroxyectoine ABC transporter permease subunit EhuD [Hydrogenophaga sp.]|jgi:polar amino acid transport system permease protein|uniref:ectoine/hydroxyectoine ABC transporter permease subunit EhuD n=1 Tax=Hydrogenophaga sp. TaxID=1904254 RepID=UPI000EC07B5A|nr:ectoine/hydroxyectoine ABC transporter permease subunit EhuD [Hydrogenophaga sp.]MDD3784063.1 ectoine/hydroxyectoine ABC transporter permease subunit EhuD [Hydrogenophaga sp.]MDX9968300.1 ectoine/hydroxyectoine ABC transporter permease subunit EhuD [Hydrogenophaga sp.]HAJ12806.1 ectoine/hydroxyectoine ABC transporter permease subunit EhuD [Comamonadaceae bacterium]